MKLALLLIAFCASLAASYPEEDRVSEDRFLAAKEPWYLGEVADERPQVRQCSTDHCCHQIHMCCGSFCCDSWYRPHPKLDCTAV